MKWSEMSDKQKLETLRYRSDGSSAGMIYFAISLAVSFIFTGFAIYFPYLDKDAEFAQALVLEFFKSAMYLLIGCVVIVVINLVWDYIKYRRHVKIMRSL